MIPAYFFLAASVNEKQNPSLATLPTEIVLKIFGNLKKVPAVILGLTCKRFHRIYKDISPYAVGLNQQSDGQRLYISLKTWMGLDYKYISSFGIFVTHGHWARYREEKRITAKILREMEAETKAREEKSTVLQAKRGTRELRSRNAKGKEQTLRGTQLHNRLRRTTKVSLRAGRSVA